jgi:hypothetical protein
LTALRVDTPDIRTIATAATRLIGICGKCGKKLGGGFGADGDKPLTKLLRKAAGARGKRSAVRIMTTACLDICPKNAVAMVDSHAPGTVLIVARHAPVSRVCTRIGLVMACE